MKYWVTILCSSAMFFTACNKEDIRNGDDEQVTAKAAVTGFYASGWEKFSSWNHTDSANFRVYSAERPTSELTTDVIASGVVVTYSKTATSDPRYMMFSKPIMLPFYFLPAGEKPINSFYWYDTNTAGVIKVSYRVLNYKEDNPPLPGDVTLPDFQFRYFIISKAYLDSKGLDAKTVKYHYTYQQLVNLLGLQG
jgi:hypothetical protein